MEQVGHECDRHTAVTAHMSVPKFRDVFARRTKLYPNERGRQSQADHLELVQTCHTKGTCTHMVNLYTSVDYIDINAGPSAIVVNVRER